MLLSLFFAIFSDQAYAVNLLQEDKEIICSNESMSVQVDKKDRFITVHEDTKAVVYESDKFLDTGILLTSQSKKESVVFQLGPNSSAVLIVGQTFDFKESNCEDVMFSKKCTSPLDLLTWSPLDIELTNNQKNDFYEVIQYGVHATSGTYFMASSVDGKKGLVLLDSGQNISVVTGTVTTLSCSYLP